MFHDHTLSRLDFEVGLNAVPITNTNY